MRDMIRIACAGILHESNTFSPLSTGMEVFRIQRGPEIIDEVMAEFEEVEWIPVLTADTTPSGPVDKETYLSLKSEIIDGIRRALPLDGVFMPLHGAMEVKEIGDGESDLTGAVREVVGTDVPVAASLDLHGNITKELCEATDILHAYRTAPHRDQIVTKRRTIQLLLECIERGLKPVGVLVKVPLLLPGEKAITEIEPGRTLYRMLEDIDAAPEIMTSSLMCGFAWADVPSASMSVMVYAETDRKSAADHANRLANDVWSKREEFGFDVETASIDESIDLALAATESTVFLSDSGDNPTAGAAGDIPLFVERLLDRKVSDAVLGGMADPDAVQSCIEAGTGNTLTLSLGGKLDTVNGRPLEVSGLVETISGDEKEAVFQTGGVRIILSADRRAYTTLAQFRRLGIDPLVHKIVVVKLGYLFPDLRDAAPKSIMALSPGFANEVIEELPFHRVMRPTYPLDKEFDWKAGDVCQVIG